MKKFLSNQREILIIIGYFCLLGLLYWYGIRPLYAEISDRKYQIQAEMTIQEEQKKQLAEIPKIKEQYLSIKQSENDLQVLLKKEEAVSLIEKLEKLAQETGNEIKITVVEKAATAKKTTTTATVSAAKDTSEDGTTAKTTDKKKDKDETIIGNLPSSNYLEMNIAVTGSFNLVTNFIQKLELIQYYSDVISLQIKLNKEKEDEKKNQSAVNPYAASPAENSDSLIDNQDSAPTIQQRTVTATLDTVFYLQN